MNADGLMLTCSVLPVTPQGKVLKLGCLGEREEESGLETRTWGDGKVQSRVHGAVDGGNPGVNEEELLQAARMACGRVGFMV